MTNKVDFDNYTDNYNQLLNESTSFFSSSDEYFAKYKIDLVRKQTRISPKRILEYGCGIGRNIAFLKQEFPDALIFGSDISNASLEIARTKLVLENESISGEIVIPFQTEGLEGFDINFGEDFVLAENFICTENNILPSIKKQSYFDKLNNK
jgi:SAM-dependent methyltransferase